MPHARWAGMAAKLAELGMTLDHHGCEAPPGFFHAYQVDLVRDVADGVPSASRRQAPPVWGRLLHREAGRWRR